MIVFSMIALSVSACGTTDDVIQSYDVVRYSVPNGTLQWTVPAAAPIKVLSQTQNELKIKVLNVTSPVTFDLEYGNQVMTITVKPFQ